VFTSLPVTIPSTINSTTKNETHARIKNLKSIKGNPTKMPADFPTPGTILPVKDMPIEGSGEEDEERISEERLTSALPERGIYKRTTVLFIRQEKSADHVVT
jgi:hypothetical protein